MVSVAVRFSTLVLSCIFLSISWAAEKPLFYRNVVEIYGNSHLVELAKASADGDKRRIDTVLKVVDINDTGYLNTPALFWALKKKKQTGYRYLLEKGANPNVIFGISKTASVMHLAASMKSAKWLEIALAFNGDVNLLNAMNETPISRAVREGLEDNVMLLIESGADLNRKGNGGYTPLHNAAISNRFDMALILIKNGADWRIKSHSGSDFIDFAKRSKVAKKYRAYQDRENVIKYIQLLESQKIMAQETVY